MSHSTPPTTSLSLLLLTGTQLLNTTHQLNESQYPPVAIPKLSLMRDVENASAALYGAVSSGAGGPGGAGASNFANGNIQGTVPTSRQFISQFDSLGEFAQKSSPVASIAEASTRGTTAGSASTPSSANFKIPASSSSSSTLLTLPNTSNSSPASVLNGITKKAKKLSKKDQHTLDTYSKRIMERYQDLWNWIEEVMHWVDVVTVELLDSLWVLGYKETPQDGSFAAATNASSNQEDTSADDSSHQHKDYDDSHFISITQKSDVLSTELSHVKEVLDTMVLLCKILLSLQGGAISNYLEKVILYNLAYKQLTDTNKNHKTYILFQNMLQKTTNPLLYLQNIFSSVNSDVMCPLLNQLIDLYEKVDLRRMRTELSAELLSAPSNRFSAPSTSQVHFQLSQAGNIDEWLAYGFLIFPQALYWDLTHERAEKYNARVEAQLKRLAAARANKNSSKSKALKFKPPKLKKIKIKAATRQLEFLQNRLLHQNYLISIGSNKVMYMHDLFEQCFASEEVLKKLKKKKWIKQAEAIAAKKSHREHAISRAQCRKHLHEVLSLILEDPPLIGPKFLLLLSLFSLAQKELLWYLRHFSHLRTKHYSISSPIHDEYLHEMIHYIERITHLCLRHHTMIEKYNYKLLKNLYTDELRRSVDSISGVLDSSQMRRIHRILDTLTGETSDENSELRSENQSPHTVMYDALRVNWKILLPGLCKSSQIAQNKNNASLHHFFSLMDQVVHISSFVDSVPQHLLAHGGLPQLYYFNDQFFHIFKTSLLGRSSEPLYALSLIRILSFYPENAHRSFNSALRQVLGERSINTAAQMLRTLSQYIASQLIEYVYLFDYERISAQNSSVEVETKSVNHVRSSSRFSVLLGSKNDKTPQYSEEDVISELLEEFKLNIQRLMLGVVDGGSELKVHNASLFPAEFLKDEIEMAIERYISEYVVRSLRSNPSSRKSVAVGSAIQYALPFTILSRCKSLIQALTIVQESLDLDVQGLVTKCLLEYLHVDLDTLSSGRSPPNNIVTQYANYLCDLCSGFDSNGDNIYFFEERKFNGSAVCDALQIDALAELGGPNAVRTVDFVMCGQIEKEISKLQEATVSLSEALTSQISPSPTTPSPSPSSFSTTHNRTESDGVPPGSFPRKLRVKIFSQGFKDNGLKSLPSFQSFIDRFTTIGALSEMRRIVLHQHEKHMQTFYPVFYNVVNTVGMRMEDDGFMQAVGMRMDDHLKSNLREVLAQIDWSTVYHGFALGYLVNALSFSYKNKIVAERESSKLHLALRGFLEVSSLLDTESDRYEHLLETARFLVAALHQQHALNPHNAKNTRYRSRAVLFVATFLDSLPSGVISKKEVEDNLPAEMIQEARLAMTG